MEIDEERLRQAIQGDAAALHLVLMSCFEPLCAYAATKIGTKLATTMSPEDVVQEAFAHVFRDLKSFSSEPAAFWKWMTVIVDNRIRDIAKAVNRQKRPPLARQLAAELHDSERSYLNLFDDLIGGHPTASRVLRAEERIMLMRSAIAELPETERQVVELRYLQEKSVSETAQAMGRTEEAIFGLCRRAKARLAERLGSASQFLSS
jgi:RNA polymerase sigma-70 factor (ECF subfamily)